MARRGGGQFVFGALYRIAVLLTIGLFHSCSAGCYFPAEMQGEFVMQLQFQGTPQGTQAGIGHVQYSQVNVSTDNIPIWGRCHRRKGNNVILMDSSGSANCIRCINMKLVARNVVQVHTDDISKCYTTEEAAERYCPDESTLRMRSKEILLYKTKELDGEDVIKEYCPISGRFTFTYNVNDGLENKQECPTSASDLNNCPNGNTMNVHFRGCSFDDHDITFECLGHWTGADNQRYLALLDTRVDANRRAQYRCAMYHEDEATGMAYMAFSSDSTCTTDLHSPTKGYETLTLKRTVSNDWPTRVEVATCKFPTWAQGRWEHVTVAHNSLTYRDHLGMKTYSVRCIGPDQGSVAERFPVFYKSQCGEETFSCVWLKQRGDNVLEFQMGIQGSDRFNNSLCSPSNFREKIWVTQGRTDRVQESPCPITGEYNGHIPDAVNLCARLSSDCTNPEVMYYTVSDCGSEVYEARPKPRYSRRPKIRQRRDADPAAADVREQVKPVPKQVDDAKPAELDSSTAAPQQGSAATAASRIFRISSSPRQTSPVPLADQQQDASWAFSNRSTSTSMWGQRTDSTLVAYAVPQAVAQGLAQGGPQARSYATGHGPMYPTSYNAHLNISTSTSATPRSSGPAFSEEEYDPWAFPKMHGLQTTSASPSVARPSPPVGPVGPAGPAFSRPVMYFNGQSGYRDPVRESSANPFYYHGAPGSGVSPLPEAGGLPPPSSTASSIREVTIGWRQPSASPSDLAATSAAGMLGTGQVGAGMGPGVGVLPGTATGGTYRGRPVEIPGPPPPPYIEARSFTGRMRIVPMAVAVHSARSLQDVHTPVMALSARAPTDRGMEFGERHGGHGFQERSSTPRRALQPHDSGWTLDAFRPRSEARSAAPFRTEERQYRCLGQWKEGERVYTYTQRKDVGTYECFVGSILSQTEIYIKEAGEHCERDVDPLQHGMLLRRKGACVGSAPVPQPSPTPRPRPTTPWVTSRRPIIETPTKPWKPRPTIVHTTPKPPVQSSASSIQASSLCLITVILFVLLRKF